MAKLLVVFLYNKNLIWIVPILFHTKPFLKTAVIGIVVFIHAAILSHSPNKRITQTALDIVQFTMMSESFWNELRG